MVDIVLPPALRVARSRFRPISPVGLTRGIYTGAPETTGYGGDRIGCSLEFTQHGGATAADRSLRAQLEAFVSMSVQKNRIYLGDNSSARRGSFPAIELLANADFANGTNGWTSSNGFVLSASDAVGRVTFDGTFSSVPQVYQPITSFVPYAPYVCRSLLVSGRGLSTLSIGPRLDANSGADVSSTLSSSRGYLVTALVPSGATGNAYGAISISPVTSGQLSGDYVLLPFVSTSRCLLADGGGNSLLQSDDFSNAAWTKNACSITPNAFTAPDGTVTADAFVENTANTGHFVTQSYGVTSAAQDVMVACVVAANARNFCYLQLNESAGGTSVFRYFNLTGGGSVGSTVVVGANWSNERSFTVNLGGSYVLCVMIARKTNGANTMTAILGSATADGTGTYLGTGVTAMNIWRATSQPASVPSRLTQSVASIVSSASQLGSGLYVKGLPASQLGLLVLGDWVEIDSQICMVVTSLDSNAAGQGYLQLYPPPRRAIADNTPIIVHRPMGRFILADQGEWSNEPGVFSTASLEFEGAPF